MKDPRFYKLLLTINGSLPLALMAYDALTNPDNLGPDPIAQGLHVTGVGALLFLMATLTVTPLRKLTGWNWLSHFRRMLGLFAFWYALSHFGIYFYFDEELSVPGLINEVKNHPYIFVGLLAFLGMIPLAITSTNGMIRYLGAADWKLLHKLTYFVAIAGVVHLFLIKQAKNDIGEPVMYGAVLALLLGYRVYAALRKSKTQKAQVPPARTP